MRNNTGSSDELLLGTASARLLSGGTKGGKVNDNIDGALDTFWVEKRGYTGCIAIKNVQNFWPYCLLAETGT